MDFLELAKNRFSSRNYLNQPIEEDKLMKVLEAARIAPSAANYQPWHFIVIRSEENRRKICTTYRREWLQKAPVIILACGDQSKAWVRSAFDNKNHTDIDISIAIDHITLQATELGLSTCWICNFDTKKCSELFNLPQNIEPIAIIPLAYPADKANPNRHETQRKPASQIIHWESF